MYDTVAITVPERDFVVTDWSRFGERTSLRGGGWKVHQEASYQEKQAGVRKPVLTITHRYSSGAWHDWLTIEGSLPKWLFGNNVEELSKEDFESLLVWLVETLDEMGVQTTAAALATAPLSKLHIGRNITLPATMPCARALTALDRLPTSRKADVTAKEWRNGGQALYYHTRRWEVVFYDKLQDIRRAHGSPSRAVDPESRFDDVPFLPRQPLLRIEERLNTTAVISAHLAQIGITTPRPSLRDVFNEEIARGLLHEKLTRLFGEGACVSTETDYAAMLHNLLGGETPMSLDQALKQVGIAAAIAEVGAAGLRTMLEGHGASRQAWSRLTKKVRAVSAKNDAKADAGEDVLQLLREGIDAPPYTVEGEMAEEVEEGGVSKCETKGACTTPEPARRDAGCDAERARTASTLFRPGRSPPATMEA